jgi:hypothetical protein
MGKRELLLIAAFVIAGAIVYQVTAPPPAPGERSFSARQLIEDFRRHLRGNRASADVTTTSTHAVDTGVTELFLGERPPEITITGENRTDISAELRVHSNAYDDAEAQSTAKATHLTMERDGVRMVAKMSYPEAGRQSATLVLRVPARLQIKMNPTSARTKMSGVASVELTNSRGESDFTQIAGSVSGMYRGGELRIADAGAVKLTTNGADVRLDRIRSDVSVNMRGGELRGSEIGGPIDLDTNGVDIELEKLDKVTGMVRINASGGSVSLKGLRTEGRIDVRGAEVDAVIERAAPLAIYAEGGESIEITPPPGGYQLDAVASHGSITLPSELLEVATNGEERRATGPINGGGPTLTLRSARGDITVRSR